MAKMELAITADTSQFSRQLRIIAKHVLALADELDIELRPWPLAEAEPGGHPLPSATTPPQEGT